MEQTNFEKIVLGFIKKIPKGYLMTYKSLAKAIKRPKSFRAVGNALNKNKDLIKIPCHRVVKSTGQVGEYRQGSDKKLSILKKKELFLTVIK